MDTSWKMGPCAVWRPILIDMTRYAWVCIMHILELKNNVVKEIIFCYT